MPDYPIFYVNFSSGSDKPLISYTATQQRQVHPQQKIFFTPNYKKEPKNCIVVSEGRYADGISAGLTFKECMQLLADKGCTFGIPLDGGGSSTIVFQGTVLNSAAGNERAVVDFLYFK